MVKRPVIVGRSSLGVKKTYKHLFILLGRTNVVLYPESCKSSPASQSVPYIYVPVLKDLEDYDQGSKAKVSRVYTPGAHLDETLNNSRPIEIPHERPRFAKTEVLLGRKQVIQSSWFV